MGYSSQIIGNSLTSILSNLFNELSLTRTSPQLMSISSSTPRNHLNIILLSITLNCCLLAFKSISVAHYKNIQGSMLIRGPLQQHPLKFQHISMSFQKSSNRCQASGTNRGHYAKNSLKFNTQARSNKNQDVAVNF